MNSVRATAFAVATRARHAVTMRSTSLKRASISSVSLYLSTCYPSFDSANRWSLRDTIRIVKQTRAHFLTSNCTRVAIESQDFCKLATSAWYRTPRWSFAHESVLVDRGARGSIPARWWGLCRRNARWRRPSAAHPGELPDARLIGIDRDPDCARPQPGTGSGRSRRSSSTASSPTCQRSSQDLEHRSGRWHPARSRRVIAAARSAPSAASRSRRTGRSTCGWIRRRGRPRSS